MTNFREELVVALYDYNSQDKEELSIRKNEQLELLDASCSWWKVKNSNGSIGMVPSNYLKRERAKAESLVNRIANKIPGNKRTRLTSNPGSDTKTLAKPVNTISNMNQTHEKYLCKYEYTAMKPDELSLSKGMSVVVSEKEDDGWWFGKSTNGQEGWFPANYVSKVSEIECAKEVNVNPPQQNSGRLMVARCLYSYTARFPEELSFEEDELLDIVEEPPNDPEWWSARKSDGIVGLVPKNYVEEESPANSRPIQSNYDQVTILKDPNHSGSQSANNNDFDGGLPAPNSQNSNKSDDKDWFFGQLKRVEAEKMLSHRGQVGEYLVRNSETSKTDFSISMKAPGRLRHFKVLILPDGQYGIGQKRFPSMDALLQYYTKSPIFTSKDLGNAYLSHPLSR